MSLMKFCGFNGFQQFADCNDEKAVEPTVFEIPEVEKNKNNLFQFGWSCNLYAIENCLTISGFIHGSPNQNKKIEFDNEINQISSNDKICLILLKSDQLFKYDFSKDQLTEVNFRTATTKSTMVINPPIKRSIFGEHINKDDKISKLDPITHICSCVSEFIAITVDGSVYSLPTKIFQLPHHVKVKDLTSGFEHFLLLNNNGDVYSWGNGSRGQLGHSNLDSVDCPKIIDALAGIKIITISAGGWHSAAVSAFGDLYVWGNNVNGQLGIQIYKSINQIGTDKQIKKRNPTVFHLPEIIDINCDCSPKPENNEDNEINNCNVVKIKCGARHSVVQMDCGRIYRTGWNAHNQLGSQNEYENDENIIDKFIPIEFVDYSKVLDIICGHWCTVFVQKKNV